MSRLLRLVPALAWASLMFYFSSQPSLHAAQIDWLDFVIKKTAHIFEYAILGQLLWFGFWGKSRLKTAFLVGLLYAFSDEIHQLFVPGRTGTLRDVFAFDTTGLIIASVISTIIGKRYAK